MSSDKKARRIRRSELQRLVAQSEALVGLLKDWPGRRIKMEYEKEWDERRQALLEQHRAPTFEPEN